MNDLLIKIAYKAASPFLVCFAIIFWISFVLIVVLFFAISVFYWLVDKIAEWLTKIGTNLSNNYYGKEVKSKEKIALDRMDKLIKELIRANYCIDILGNPPMAKSTYDDKMRTLTKLESLYPHFVKKYSPTQYCGYKEDMAILAFQGHWHHDWPTIRRTLILTIGDIGNGQQIPLQEG